MKTFYYENVDDDVVKSKNQDKKLKKNYKWIHTNIFYIILSYLLYYIVLLIAFIYCKVIKHFKYEGKIKIKKGFVYSNHTLELGDVLNPFIYSFPRRPYIICSPANLGIPVIGPLLPMAGALVIPDNVHDMIKFKDAVSKRSKKHLVIIYPEAHLWPYYTGIRDFKLSPFHFPVENNSLVYVSTTIFNSRIKIKLDGPITFNKELDRRENYKILHDEVYNTLVSNSKLSDKEYVKYIKKPIE